MKYIAQDILRVTPSMGAIAHQTNSVGVVGGLNKAVCDKFPANLQVSSSRHTFGKLIIVSTPQAIVGNCVAQMFPGPARTLPGDSFVNRRLALTGCLTQLAQWLSEQPDTIGKAIYVPYSVSCGMTGDSWREVSRVLEQWDFNQELVELWICVPNWAEEKVRARGVDVAIRS